MLYWHLWHSLTHVRACVVSAYRVSVLSTMDFADITYSIPLANIFSGLEPSLAVILACVPLMRPLLGKSVGSSAGQSRSAYPVSGRSDRGKPPTNEFEPLDDESQYRLRPIGVKHQAEVTTYGTQSEGSDGGGEQKFASDIESMESGRNGRGPGHERSRSAVRKISGGINVTTEWTVSNGNR